jgi:hypothetical protein
MQPYTVRGHHRVVNDQAIWVEEYFRNGQKVSEEEATVIRAHRMALRQGSTNMALTSSSDPTLGGCTTESQWAPERKQEKVAELQSTLNPMALPPYDRQMIEHHMNEFLLNADPVTDDQMYEALVGVFEHAHQQTVANQMRAESMLNQLGRPSTDYGRRAQQALQDVLHGQAPLEFSAMNNFEEAIFHERRAKQSVEAAQELLPHMGRLAGEANNLARQVNTLREHPQEVFPRFTRSFEDTSHMARTLIARISDDPTLSKQMESSVHAVHGAIVRSEDAIRLLQSRHRSGAPTDPYAVDALMHDVQVIQREMHSMGTRVRTMMEGA